MILLVYNYSKIKLEVTYKTDESHVSNSFYVWHAEQSINQINQIINNLYTHIIFI